MQTRIMIGNTVRQRPDRWACVTKINPAAQPGRRISLREVIWDALAGGREATVIDEYRFWESCSKSYMYTYKLHIPSTGVEGWVYETTITKIKWRNGANPKPTVI